MYAYRDEQTYLGDAVYAEIAGDMVKLTTRDGGPEATNTIFLEPYVFDALIQWLRYIGWYDPPPKASDE